MALKMDEMVNNNQISIKHMAQTNGKSVHSAASTLDQYDYV